MHTIQSDVSIRPHIPPVLAAGDGDADLLLAIDVDVDVDAEGVAADAFLGSFGAEYFRESRDPPPSPPLSPPPPPPPPPNKPRRDAIE